MTWVRTTQDTEVAARIVGRSGVNSCRSLCTGRPHRVSAGRVEVLARPERGLGPVGDAEPLKDARQVGFHGPFCDAEAAGDLLVGEAIADELEHLAFALSQLRCLLSRAPRLEQRSCRFRIER